MLTGIDNVGVAVTDLTRSIVFYEKLGFTKGQEYEADVKGCSMTCGSAVLFLFQTKQTSPQAVKREPTLVQNPPGSTISHFGLKTSTKCMPNSRLRGLHSWVSLRIKTGAHVW